VSPVDLGGLVREIPDFPEAGILFKDSRARLAPYPVHAVLE
jgi:hypothetical protein